MIKKAKRFFNTSGHNIPGRHYTLSREKLIENGVKWIKEERYFTIWAPRQTGKSTYFMLLAERLREMGYGVIHANVENFKNVTEEDLLTCLATDFKEMLDIEISSRKLSLFYNELKQIKDRKIVFIIDEIEGLNPDVLGQFLHTIRNLYQSRITHSLKSVILVGVINIAGVIQDHSSPFNIADNLEIPYFTKEETFQLLHMHEEETGQLFDLKVKQKICDITANQPGLVNGFANRLVTQNPDKQLLDYEDYLKVEHWYIKIAIDKNISNIINKAKKHQQFVERLLFNENPVVFAINDERIKFLAAFGVITNDDDGYITFKVPLYKKVLMDAFYPYTNGESQRFLRDTDLRSLMDKKGNLNFDPIIDNYKNYVKRRSFKYFREKDETTGSYKSIKEAALAYSFETYLQVLVQLFDGKSYLEPHTGLGRCDLLLNIKNREYVIEFKIYREMFHFEKGKTQLAYYAKSLGLNSAVYLVFVPHTVTLPGIVEKEENIEDITIRTYIVFYDEEKDF